MAKIQGAATTTNTNEDEYDPTMAGNFNAASTSNYKASSTASYESNNVVNVDEEVNEDDFFEFPEDDGVTENT